MSTSECAADTIKLQRKDYTVLDYASLQAAGFGDVGWFSGAASPYHGRRVVTTGSLQFTCDFDKQTNPVARMGSTASRLAATNPNAFLDFGITLYWGNLPAKRLESFRAACTRFADRIGMRDDNYQPVVIVYGLVNNGGGEGIKNCRPRNSPFINENARKCLHLIVEDIYFGDVIFSNGQVLGQLGTLAVKAVGPQLVRFIVTQTFGGS